MLHADQLKAALLQRVGMRADITAAKIDSQLAKVPSDERDSWVQHLVNSPPQSPDWQAFIEPFLIHETYFFRHENQLEFLASKVLPALLEERLKSGRHEFRIWCAACSSGEEAFTAALLLRDAIQGSREAAKIDWRISVTGTDLSAEVLLKARTGEYHASAGLNSFRDVPAFAKHHFPSIFQRAEKTWRPDDALKRTVHFHQRNLVTDPAPVSDVDLVMCRNVLIYLDEQSVRRSIETIHGALRPGGVLVLGPADMLKHADGWELLTNQKAMFWRKSASSAHAQATSPQR
jgi:chemotaxis methyl-accepting protein methylase